MNPHNARAEHALKKLLPEHVFCDEETRFRYSFDSVKVSFMPRAVVIPRKEEEVGVVLKLANRYKVPVVPRGAGSSRTGGATPIEGGWVLDLVRLNRLRVDARQGLAIAQAGVITARLQERAEACGWFYPPDPSSAAYSTLGGNIACNAGGLRGGKYGVTRDYVLALSGFLPTGEYVRWGRNLRKFAAGLNLRDLWIGSEGLLGVVTQATMKLLPLPASKWTAMVAFKDNRSALVAAQDLLESGVFPSICEFLDRNAVRGAESYSGSPVFPGKSGSALLLVEVDGSAEEVRTQASKVRAWGRKSGIGTMEAPTTDEAERLWRVRRTCSTAMFRLADSKLNEDVVVPLSRQKDLVRFAEGLEKRLRLPVAVFGHAADGNLHVNILYHQGEPEEVERAHRGVVELMEKVVSLGGAISGEHGIGLSKTPFLKTQHSAAEIAAMKKVKDALDPAGILNPMKMFAETRIWELPKVKHRFPWEKQG